MANKFRCLHFNLKIGSINFKVMIDINLLFLVKFTGNFMLEITKILFWFGEILSGGIKFLSSQMKFGFLKANFADHLKLSIMLKH